VLKGKGKNRYIVILEKYLGFRKTQGVWMQQILF
jgi:hypothetical protein